MGVSYDMLDYDKAGIEVLGVLISSYQNRSSKVLQNDT